MSNDTLVIHKGMVFHKGIRVWLPDRRIDELVCVETLERVETRPHRCPPGRDCPHVSHLRRQGFYFNDERPNSPWASRHEDGAWVCYYAMHLHSDLLYAWDECMGSTSGDFAIASLRAIHWTDGRTLLVVTAVNLIFDMWATIESPAEVPNA